MEKRCVEISALTDMTKDWVSKLILTEKTPIRIGKERGAPYQRFVFNDSQKNSIQGIAYSEDVHQLDKVLQLYKTFYVGNAMIRPILGTFPRYASSGYQLILKKSAFIRQVRGPEELALSDYYSLTKFMDFDTKMDDPEQKINVLCSIIHVLSPRTVPVKGRSVPIQEFIILNEECRPLILTFWEDFLHIEGPSIVNTVHEMPIILGMRLGITSFHGISVRTLSNSTILFDPPLVEAAQLRKWLETNTKHVEKIVVEKLYEKQHQVISTPADTQVRKISQLLALTETIKSCWIKAEVKIKNPGKKFYYLICPNCMKATGAGLDVEFTCLYCAATSPAPQAQLRFYVELSDGSANLQASIDKKSVEMLLGLTIDEVIDIEKRHEEIDHTVFNAKFEGLKLLFHLRINSFMTRT